MFFKKPEKKKEQKITGNEFRIRVYRLRNNTPVEVDGSPFEAEMIRKEDKSVVLISEENKFKEELATLIDPIISDVIYKLKSRNKSKEEQIKEVDEAITNQETRISEIKEGRIKNKLVLITEKDDKGKEKQVEKQEKVNVVSEENKLRLLKVAKYTLEKSENGSYELVESDGMPTLTYTIQDSELIPNYYNVPKEKNEPLTIRPEVASNKKYYKEVQDILDKDYLDATKDPFAGWFGLVIKVLIVVMFVVGIFWNVQLGKREAHISEMEEKSASGICLKTQAECTKMLGIQMDTNQVYIDYAKSEMKRIEQERNKTK